MNEFTCRQLAELLLDYVAGELSAEQHALVKKHMGLCPPCVTFVHTYEVTVRITRQLPPQPLPAALVARLKAALCEMQQDEPPATA